MYKGRYLRSGCSSRFLSRRAIIFFWCCQFPWWRVMVLGRKTPIIFLFHSDWFLNWECLVPYCRSEYVQAILEVTLTRAVPSQWSSVGDKNHCWNHRNNHWPQMFFPPEDNFSANQKSLYNGPWILAIIIHTPINKRNSPCKHFYIYILSLVLFINTPSMKYLKTKICNNCSSIRSVYAVNWTHIFCFLASARRHCKMIA